MDFQGSVGTNHRVKKANEIYQDSQSFLTAEIYHGIRNYGNEYSRKRLF